MSCGKVFKGICGELSIIHDGYVYNIDTLLHFTSGNGLTCDEHKLYYRIVMDLIANRENQSFYRFAQKVR